MSDSGRESDASNDTDSARSAEGVAALEIELSRLVEVASAEAVAALDTEAVFALDLEAAGVEASVELAMAVLEAVIDGMTVPCRGNSAWCPRRCPCANWANRTSSTGLTA